MHLSRRKILTVFISTCWVISIAAGVHLLWRYEAYAGVAAEPPAFWPEQSRIAPSHGQSSLVLFAHPHCPCTRATMAELAEIMARCGDRVRTTVVILHPDGVDDGWEQSSIWPDAENTPGVAVIRDDGCIESKRFGVATSGQALLYSPDGRLLFTGGITAGRGHVGDNFGRAAIMSLILHSPSPKLERIVAGSVYGCPLFPTASPDVEAGMP
jgi:hypothetical protein